MKQSFTLNIDCEDTMEQLGAAVAKACSQSIIIFLQGNLGAGKTVFARGFLRGLGYQGKVKSPTYTLVESYNSSDYTIYHFDLYRLADPEELHFLGIRDYMLLKSICLIEWPEKAKSYLPEPDLICMIDHQQVGRKVNLIANTDIGTLLLQQLHEKNR